MKGILFREFLDLLEKEFGMETLDSVLTLAGPMLSTNGAYTTVGTYPHQELLSLIEATLSITSANLDNMLNVYAEGLMQSFERSHPSFFSAHKDLVSFLLNVEGQMHAGVRKLYADAKPPTLDVSQIDDSSLKLCYRSLRPLSIVVQPLVRAAAKRYKTGIQLEQVEVSSDGTYSEHTLRMV